MELSSYGERKGVMAVELFVMLVIALAVLGASAAAFGVDSRPGLHDAPRNI